MSDVVIKAEGLGKKYLIGHQTERVSMKAEALLAKLPLLHHDLFDRLLICQSIRYGLIIQAVDRAIEATPARWLALDQAVRATPAALKKQINNRE